MIEKICMWIAWYLLPRKVVLWAAIRVGANATTGKWSKEEVPTLLFMDAIKRWDSVEEEVGKEDDQLCE